MRKSVLIIYRYFTGIYHFFGSFSEWYGIRKSGMVFLLFGSTSSDQRWFAERRLERRGEPRTASNPQASMT